ncbi:universal stress protein [Hoeflea ulvae]|uniref:Universal stress protein n=1 Tax=Hoeflea ulvae TaxID=2983764 RepID=A0ABT3YGZ4_9HYPH|nr:universal stress protein [Hoeflea ulvae]MCY0095151.1 universal stress protein [Hoeflea ulvae]
MYKHILVAVALDDEHDPEQSLQAAEVLAAGDGRVTILHVKESVPNYVVAYLPEGHETGVMEAMHNRLNGLTARLKNAKGVLVEGHAGRTIVQWAKANAVDCIIIASHRPGLQDYLLGSTAARVVRHAQCSVHVMR